MLTWLRTYILTVQRKRLMSIKFRYGIRGIPQCAIVENQTRFPGGSPHFTQGKNCSLG